MLAIMFSTLLLAAPVPKDGKPAQPGILDGVWNVTEYDMRGRTIAVKDGAAAQSSYTMVITGGEYAFRTHAGTITIDAEKKSIDLKVTSGRFEGGSCPCIFERTGNTLKMAIPTSPGQNVGRPAELKTDARARYYVYTFELDKTATAEQTAAKLKELKAMVALIPAAPQVNGGLFPPAPARGQPAEAKTQETLEKILEKLEKIEKRLEELEKKK